MADLLVEGKGGDTVFLLRPCNDGALAWLIEHTIDREAHWFGKALAVEHRYIRDIIEGAINDGLEVGDGDGRAIRRDRALPQHTR